MSPGESQIIYDGQIGRLKFSLIQGDIFKAGADAIVNSEQTDFSLSSVPTTISGQIRRRYGRAIQDELDCLTQREVLGSGTVLTTSGGSEFRHIYHAGFHAPDDWPDMPGGSSEADFLTVIGICIDQVLQMASADGVHVVAIPLIGCGLVGLDEKMLVLQFLDSLHKCERRMRQCDILHVKLVIRDAGQARAVVSQLISLLLDYEKRAVLIDLPTVGCPVLDRFASAVGRRAEESWAKWQLCRLAELALEVMCFSLCQSCDCPPTPETLFGEGVAATFGVVREQAVAFARSDCAGSRDIWGAKRFRSILQDADSLNALMTLNSERNNLAHGRHSIAYEELRTGLEVGLRLNEWNMIEGHDGPFPANGWNPWMRCRPDQGNSIGVFERWQKNSLRYLVPETGELFKVARTALPRDSDQDTALHSC